MAGKYIYECYSRYGFAYDAVVLAVFGQSAVGGGLIGYYAQYIYPRMFRTGTDTAYYIGKIRCGQLRAHSGFYVAFAYVYKYLGRTVFDYIVKPVCQSCQVIGVYSPVFYIRIAV